MKTSIFISTLFATTLAYSAAFQPALQKSYSFHFKGPKSKVFSITQTAPSMELAFKSAASECYKKLTGNKYPGEEKGLEIIDICANPKI